MSQRYQEAGVNLTAGQEAVDLIRDAVKQTCGPEVLAGVGAFGGLFDASRLPPEPVLVASTDGVGTKVMLAVAWGRYDGIGHDIVNHCVNDILVQGARPLFFLDYVASDRLQPHVVAAIVRGMAEACREVGCALLGGETAEMPGVYAKGQLDVVGTIVGVVSRTHVLPRPDIAPGDMLVGLPSSGPHTNGYSLIRSVLGDASPHMRLAGGKTLAETLLAPHRCYAELVERVRAVVPVKGLVHVTGGGLVDNVPRVLPPGCGARIRRGSWPIPPVFSLIQRRGRVSDEEMAHVFNLGIGMVIIVAAEDVDALLGAIGEPAWVIGEVVAGEGVTL